MLLYRSYYLHERVHAICVALGQDTAIKVSTESSQLPISLRARTRLDDVRQVQQRIVRSLYCAHRHLVASLLLLNSRAGMEREGGGSAGERR